MKLSTKRNIECLVLSVILLGLMFAMVGMSKLSERPGTLYMQWDSEQPVCHGVTRDVYGFYGARSIFICDDGRHINPLTGYLVKPD